MTYYYFMIIFTISSISYAISAERIPEDNLEDQSKRFVKTFCNDLVDGVDVLGLKKCVKYYKRQKDQKPRTYLENIFVLSFGPGGFRNVCELFLNTPSAQKYYYFIIRKNGDFKQDRENGKNPLCLAQKAYSHCKENEMYS